MKNNDKFSFLRNLIISPKIIRKIEQTPISNENKKTVSVVPMFDPKSIAKADFSFIRLADKKAINIIVSALDDDIRIVRIIPNKKAMW